MKCCTSPINKRADWNWLKVKCCIVSQKWSNLRQGERCDGRVRLIHQLMRIFWCHLALINHGGRTLKEILEEKRKKKGQWNWGRGLAPSHSDGELLQQNKLTQTQMNGVSPPTLWYSENKDFPCLQHRTHTHTVCNTHTEKSHPWLSHTHKHTHTDRHTHSGQTYGWSDKAARNTHTRTHTQYRS